MTKKLKTDVLVIGGGPAGSAVALRLLDAGDHPAHRRARAVPAVPHRRVDDRRVRQPWCASSASRSR